MNASPQDPVGLEQPVEDVVEQRAEVPPEPPEPAGAELPLEADAADAAEQLVEAGVDDEDET
jgi:hypothetical protein